MSDNHGFITMVLQNNEASSDIELVTYFMRTLKVSEGIAKGFVSQRGACLRDFGYEVKH